MTERSAFAGPTPVRWRPGRIIRVRRETPTVKTFVIEVPNWTPHLPGQHYDVRLTAPDGYRAQRSYSVASSPLDEGLIEFTIERLADGEVSMWFHDLAEVGDEFEVRGPLTAWFTWQGESPVLLVGGGSGVVPLMSMLRHKRRTAPDVRMSLLYAVRTPVDVIYADELGDDALITYTREAPAGWTGHTGRIDAAMVAAAGHGGGRAYVCGSSGFVETVTGLLLAAGFEPGNVRTERFGATGRSALTSHADRPALEMSGPSTRIASSTGVPPGDPVT